MSIEYYELIIYSDKVTTITDKLRSSELKGDFKFTLLKAEILLKNTRQSANRSPKEIIVETNPPGLSYETVYTRRPGPPTGREIYQVFVTVDSTNHRVKTSGIFSLGRSFESTI